MKKTFYSVMATALTALTFSAQAQIISTIAGTGIAGYTGDGGAATAANIDNPFGIAVDAAGNVYYADYNQPVVRKIDASGIITTVAGTTGTGAYPGDGGAAIAAGIVPLDVAVDGAGNLYIADYTHHRIRKVNTSGIISTIAGTGVAGFTGIGGPATAAKLNFPIAVAVDAAGNVFIADRTNHMVKKVNASTGALTVVAGTGLAGFSGDGGAANLAKLDQPMDIALDAAGNIYVVDYMNYRIRKIDVSGNISTFAGSGAYGPLGDGGPATAAELFGAIAVGTDAAGNVYISEDAGGDKVRVVSTSGIISTFAGTGVNGFSGDGGAATAAQLDYTRGVASDGSGNVYISDVGNHRIRKVTAPVTTFTSQLLPGETTSPNIFPNPSNGFFTVGLPTTATTVTVTITDILGKEISAITAGNTRQVNFSLGNAPSGSYIVKVQADNNTYRTNIMITK